MQSLLSSLLIVLLTSCVVAAQSSARSRPDAEKEIANVARQRLDAFGRADATAWSQFVADDCLCGLGGKDGLRREIANRPSSLKIWFGEILDLQVRVYADTAVARYRVTEHTGLGEQRIGVQQWRVETYIRRAGGWTLIGGIDSVIMAEPAVAKIDWKLVDAFIGQYEYAPGVIDTVTREGDHLMVQATGQEKEEVFPENESTVFGKGQDWRLIFVKNDQGKVTHVLFRQHGHDFVAKKIK